MGEGIAVIHSPHTTGALVLNEDESALREDLKNLVTNLIPAQGDYRHPDNAFAHLRSMLLSSSRVIPIHGGKPALGRLQSLYWLETERRPRRRTVEIVVLGE